MTTSSPLAEIGKITRLHGFKGELTVHVTITAPSQLISPKEVTLTNVNGEQVYKVVSFSMKTPTMAKLKLEGVDSEDIAKALIGSRLSFPAANLPESEQLKGQLRSMIGYTVVDKKIGILGSLNDVVEYPGNPLLLVQYKNKEVMIPLHPSFLHSIDTKKKEIHVITPEGLFEL